MESHASQRPRNNQLSIHLPPSVANDKIAASPSNSHRPDMPPQSASDVPSPDTPPLALGSERLERLPTRFPPGLSAPASEGDDIFDKQHSKSIVDLTTSALAGIYSGTALEGVTATDGTSVPATPATGSTTPSSLYHRSRSFLGMASLSSPEATQATKATKAPPNQSQSHQQEQVQGTNTREKMPPNTVCSSFLPRTRRGLWNLYLPLSQRAFILFIIGISYAVLVSHLHRNPSFAPRVAASSSSTSGGSSPVHVVPDLPSGPGFKFAWGAAGIILGGMLPYLDHVLVKMQSQITDFSDSREPSLYDREGRRRPRSVEHNSPAQQSSSPVATTDWSLVFRGVGCFVGIAFAIRKLPWQSTSQASLTLALVNPFLWYVIDRTAPGFVLSTVVGVGGMLMLLATNTDLLPRHEETGVTNHHATIVMANWIASVFFCSCICFGNIGRKLMLK